jgi:integrase/recombinase XerC
MPNNIPHIIQPFLDSLKFEKRYSSHTLRSYHDDLIQFFDFLELQFGGTDVAAIASPMVRSWLASLKDERLTGKTITRKLSSLKSFFKYLLRTGVIDVSPMVNIVAPRISKRLPEYVEQKDITRLLNGVEFPDTWQGKTDKLLISLFYHTGMRLSELVNLKESYIDAGNQTLKVLGKGNKERIIPVSSELAGQVAAYQAGKRSEPGFDTEYLLVNKSGRKLYHKYVYLVVNRYLGHVTTLGKKSPHVLRHTFATHLTNNGADLNSVKELLGHASLAATQVYTHNSIERLKSIHKKAHPKS